MALLRYIKRARPDIITMMGGANCEGIMGHATHRFFSWIDYVVSGEADLILGGLVKDIMNAEHGLHSAALGNASQAELQDLMDNVLRLRLQIAKGKMRCRENMRKVLNEQQWNKVVSIYRQRIM